MAKNNTIKMTKEEFKNLMNDCGFKTYTELANSLNVTFVAVKSWDKKGEYPKYLKTALQWHKIAKKYDKLVASNKEQVEELEIENKKLELELERLKKIKNILIQFYEISKSK